MIREGSVKTMGDEDYVSFSERLEIREDVGRQKGEIDKLVSQICKKLTKGNTEEEIAEILEEELDVIQAICEIAQPYAPNYDVEAISNAYARELRSEEKEERFDVTLEDARDAIKRKIMQLQRHDLRTTFRSLLNDALDDRDMLIEIRSMISKYFA